MKKKGWGKRLIKVLKYCDQYCYCSSYHNYRCEKCRHRLDGHNEDPETWAEAREKGWITWEGHGPPNLTKEGKSLLAAITRCDFS